LYVSGQKEPDLILNSGVGEGITLPNLQMMPTPMRIGLSLADGFERDRPYRLGVRRLMDFGAPVEGEPNDKKPMEIGAGTLVGFLHGEADVDRFAVDLSESTEAIEAENAVPSGSVDEKPVAAEVVPSAEDRTIAAVIPRSEKVPAKWLPHIRVRPLLKGLTLEVRGLPGMKKTEMCGLPSDSSRFDLEVRAVQRPSPIRNDRPHYRVDIQNQADLPGIENEPNEEMKSADVLLPDEPRRGTLFQQDDKDLYVFSVVFDDSEAGQDPAPAQEVAVKLTPGGKDILTMAMVDSEGGVVARTRGKHAGGEVSLALELPKGIYFLGVTSEGATGCEPYAIQLKHSVQVEGEK
jgi:hypothetical protein